MSTGINQSSWARLFRIARSLIHQVNSQGVIIDHWTFGGGTAMMLQIDHRESHDVDFFLQGPQLLPFLDPQKRDFKFEIAPTDYDGDGATFLKLAFENIGEIDFIVSQPKTASPTIQRDIEGEPASLETLPEIIAKKSSTGLQVLSLATFSISLPRLRAMRMRSWLACARTEQK